MKNYNKFIYEQNTFDGFDVDEIVKVIQEDCKPYLDKFDTALFRGMNINSEDSAVFSLFDRFKHREPRTTSIEAHTVLDNVFNEEFGWKARSEGVFVDQNFGNEYGSGLYLFFPRGDFDYLWSPKVEDLLSYVEYSLYDFTYKSYLEDISNGDHIYYDYAKGEEDEIDRGGDKTNVKSESEWELAREKYFRSIVQTYRVDGVPSKERRSNEIMFNVDQYYLLYYKNIWGGLPFGKALSDNYNNDVSKVLDRLGLKV